jgi:hypothetical protein
MMMRTPTVPFFVFPVGDDIGDGRVVRIDRFDQAEPARVLRLHFEGVARVVTVHRERRHQHRAVDPDRIHGRCHLVARHLRRSD